MSQFSLKFAVAVLAASTVLACRPTGGKSCATAEDCVVAGYVCVAGKCELPSSLDGGFHVGVGGGAGGGDMGGGGGGGADLGGNGETCQTAARIMPGTLTGDTTGKASDYDPGCTGAISPGPDSVYQITVPAGQRLTAIATPMRTDAGAYFDVALYSIVAPASRCDAAADGGADMCASASDNPTDPRVEETVIYANSGADPIELFLVVDSFYDQDVNFPDGGPAITSQGRFTLDTALSELVPGDVCETALPLQPGVALVDQDLANFGFDYQGSESCQASDGPDVAYQLVVPPGQLATFTVTPAADFDPVISIAEGPSLCSHTCIDSVDKGGEGAPETLSYRNTSSHPVTLFVVVGAYGEQVGQFQIVGALSTPPADDDCQMPTELTAGVVLSGQSTEGYNNDYVSEANTLGCSFSASRGPDRVYSMTVPARQRARVVVTPDADFGPSIDIIEGPPAACGADPRVCVSGGYNPFSHGEEVAYAFNAANSPKTYFVVVDSGSSGGTFQIGFTTEVPAADDTCSSAATVLTTGTRTDELGVGFASDYGTGGRCYLYFGADRVYTVHLAADEKYTATVTPTNADGGLDPVINFVSGGASRCETVPFLCESGADRYLENSGETASFSNNSDAPLDLFLVIGNYRPTAAAPGFTLASAIGPTPEGENCRHPQTVTAGTLLAQNNQGASADVVIDSSSVGCIRVAGAVDKVYSATVPAGQTLTVTATPATQGSDGGLSDDLTINLIEGPAANCNRVLSCLNSADNGGAGEPETVSYANNSGEPKQVFIQIVGATWDFSFSLGVQLQ